MRGVVTGVGVRRCTGLSLCILSVVKKGRIEGGVEATILKDVTACARQVRTA